jgi:hypothetical protein
MSSGYLSNQTKGVDGFVDANHTPPTPHLDGSKKATAQIKTGLCLTLIFILRIAIICV